MSELAAIVANFLTQPTAPVTSESSTSGTSTGVQSGSGTLVAEQDLLVGGGQRVASKSASSSRGLDVVDTSASQALLNPILNGEMPLDLVLGNARMQMMALEGEAFASNNQAQVLRGGLGASLALTPNQLTTVGGERMLRAWSYEASLFLRTSTANSDPTSLSPIVEEAAPPEVASNSATASSASSSTSSTSTTSTSTSSTSTSSTSTSSTSTSSTSTSSTSSSASSSTPASGVSNRDELLTYFSGHQNPGNGGDNWIARVPAGIQAQINANGGNFTGHVTLLTQRPSDLDIPYGTHGYPDAWWTGSYVSTMSELAAEWRNEDGTYWLPRVPEGYDLLTGLPAGALQQSNVFFQPLVSSDDNGSVVLGMQVQNVGVFDPSLVGWQQAPTLCLEEVEEVLKDTLRELGVPEANLSAALENCYRYDPLFGVLIPDGIGLLAQQRFNGKHDSDWVGTAIEMFAIGAIAWAGGQAFAAAALASGATAAVASGFSISQVAAGNIIASAASGAINAGLTGGNVALGALAGGLGPVAGQGASAAVGGGLLGSVASGVASSAVSQLITSGQINLTTLAAAGLGAGITTGLNATNTLPPWAASFAGTALGSAIATGDWRAALLVGVNAGFTALMPSQLLSLGSLDGIRLGSGNTLEGPGWQDLDNPPGPDASIEELYAFYSYRAGWNSGVDSPDAIAAWAAAGANPIAAGTPDEVQAAAALGSVSFQRYDGDRLVGISSGMLVEVPGPDGQTTLAIATANHNYNRGGEASSFWMTTSSGEQIRVDLGSQQTNAGVNGQGGLDNGNHLNAQDGALIPLPREVAERLLDPSQWQSLPYLSSAQPQSGSSVYQTGFPGYYSVTPDNDTRVLTISSGTVVANGGSVIIERGAVGAGQPPQAAGSSGGGLLGAPDANGRVPYYGSYFGNLNTTIGVFTPFVLDPSGVVLMGQQSVPPVSSGEGG